MTDYLPNSGSETVWLAAPGNPPQVAKPVAVRSYEAWVARGLEHHRRTSEGGDVSLEILMLAYLQGLNGEPLHFAYLYDYRTTQPQLVIRDHAEHIGATENCPPWQGDLRSALDRRCAKCKRGSQRMRFFHLQRDGSIDWPDVVLALCERCQKECLGVTLLDSIP